MSVSTRRGALVLRLAAAVLVTGPVALSACGGDPEQPETGSDAPDIRGSEDLEDPYDGPYTSDFREDVEAYVGQEVTLEAAVDRVVSPVAFTITGPDGEDVGSLLVLANEPLPSLKPGQEVVIAAVPQDDFDVSVLDDDRLAAPTAESYETWEGDPYLSAGVVITSTAEA
ncbi:hypothetical protein [Geodermatophilus sp. SYSU D00684]